MKLTVLLCTLLFAINGYAQYFHEIKTDLQQLANSKVNIAYELTNLNQGFEVSLALGSQTFKSIVYNNAEHFWPQTQRFRGHYLRGGLGWRKYFSSLRANSKANYFLGSQTLARFRIEEPSNEFLIKYANVLNKELELQRLLEWTVDMVLGIKTVFENSRITMESGFGLGADFAESIAGLGPINLHTEINVKLGLILDKKRADKPKFL